MGRASVSWAGSGERQRVEVVAAACDTVVVAAGAAAQESVVALHWDRSAQERAVVRWRVASVV